MHRYNYMTFLVAVMIAVAVATAAPGVRETYTLRADQQQLVDDGRPDEPPLGNFGVVQRSDGRWIVLLGVDAKNHTYIKILRERAKGHFEVQHVMRGEVLEATNAVMGVTVLDQDRALADLHINPSTGVGVLIDFAHLERSRAYPGIGFAWNGNGRHLAYFRGPPHFRSPDDPVWTELHVDGKLIQRFDGYDGEQINWQDDGNLIVLLARPDHPSERRRVRYCGEPETKPDKLTQKAQAYVAQLRTETLAVRSREVITGTDFGGRLLIYTQASEPVRLQLRVGLSREDVVTDYYFQEAKLCYACQEIIAYGIRDNGSRDTSKIVRKVRCEWAIHDNRVVSTTGHICDEMNPDELIQAAGFLMKHIDDNAVDMERFIMGHLPH